jgi:hypothetical protein
MPRPSQKDHEYLIAHTSGPEKSDVAQAVVPARSESVARNVFKRDYPERTIHVVGIRGSEG